MSDRTQTNTRRAGQANEPAPAPDATPEEPVSSETVAGGRYEVDGAIVDANGNPIDDKE